jgi:hypothetical protein
MKALVIGFLKKGNKGIKAEARGVSMVEHN